MKRGSAHQSEKPVSLWKQPHAFICCNEPALIADLLGLAAAIHVVVALTPLAGPQVALRMGETLRLIAR